MYIVETVSCLCYFRLFVSIFFLCLHRAYKSLLYSRFHSGTAYSSVLIGRDFLECAYKRTFTSRFVYFSLFPDVAVRLPLVRQTLDKRVSPLYPEYLYIYDGKSLHLHYSALLF